MSGRGKKHKNAIQLSLMVALSLLVQALSLYKSHFTAVKFGATEFMDAYNYAFSIAIFVFSFVTSGITTVIVPSYVKKEKPEVINSFITLIYSAVLLLVGMILLFRFPLLRMLTANSDSFNQMVGDWLFITFFIQGVTAFLAVTTAYFQCIDHFLVPKLVLLFVNLGVTAAMVSGMIQSLHSYLLLQSVASVVSFVFDVGICVALGFRYHPQFQWKNPETQRLLLLFVPILFSSGIYKISTFIDTTIAARLPEGRLTILSYATHVINMVNNVVVGNLTVYIYPKIVRRLDQEDHKKYFWDYQILFHAIIVMLAAGFFTVGRECLALIFGGGKFSPADTRTLFILVCIYMFGQQLNVLRDLIYRYFYAQSDTKTPVKNSLLVSAVNISVSIVLAKMIGVYGIIIGTVVASLVSFARITWQMKMKFGLGVRFSGVLIEFLKTLMAFGTSVGSVFLLRSYVSIHNRLLTIGVFGTATAAVFILVLVVTRSKVFHVKLS